jgi:hypothetical protein
MYRAERHRRGWGRTLGLCTIGIDIDGPHFKAQRCALDWQFHRSFERVSFLSKAMVGVTVGHGKYSSPENFWLRDPKKFGSRNIYFFAPKKNNMVEKTQKNAEDEGHRTADF